MNLAIKTLEKIGQNASLKQHDDLTGMLDDLNVKEEIIENIDAMNNELICGLFPADDDSDGDDTKDKDTDGDKDKESE